MCKENNPSCNSYFRKKKDNLETRVLEQVLKSAKAFENASIDQRAFLRSRANDSNVDLKKYVDEVKAEMAAEEGSDGKEYLKCFPTLYVYNVKMQKYVIKFQFKCR